MNIYSYMKEDIHKFDTIKSKRLKMQKWMLIQNRLCIYILYIL